MEKWLMGLVTQTSLLAAQPQKSMGNDPNTLEFALFEVLILSTFDVLEII